MIVRQKVSAYAPHDYKAKSVSCRKGVISMAKVIRVRTTTHIRRVGTGMYQVRTTVSNGKSTRTSTKTVRIR